MPRKSSSFVKIHYFNYNRIIRELHSCASALRQANDKIDSIRLFGSLVKGNYAPGSDADVLIILSSDLRRKIDRIPEFLQSFSEVSVGVDVIPLTRDEIQQAITEGNLFIQSILKEGLELGL